MTAHSATTSTASAVPRPRSGSLASRQSDLLHIVNGARQPRLVFQPIVDLQRGMAVGYEALARFASRLTTAPGPWFEAAADTPHAAPLEAILVRTALAARPGLPADCFVSINVAPGLLSHPTVLRELGAGGDLSDVVFELTEHVRFERGAELRDAVTALRQRGARFALDDVGAGWAGLQQVMDLRPDVVKLDRSLVAEAPGDPVRQAIAQMLLDLCSRLGLDLLVEGVETYEELDLFARMGVPLGQGHVFGIPADTTPRLVDDDLAVRLKFRAGLSRHPDKVAALVEMSRADVHVGPVPPAEVGARPVVLVDGVGRPTALVVADGAGVVHRHPVMCIMAAEAIASVAQRAMTRPLRDRFLPLVCVDRAGNYVGIVPVEALTLALAAAPAPEPAAERRNEVRLP